MFLIPSRLAFRAAEFFLASTRVFYPERDVGKLKVTVGTIKAGGLKCPAGLRPVGGARSDPDFIGCFGSRRFRRARSYPNLIRGGSGLARLRSSGHVDDNATKSTHPSSCVHQINTMPIRRIEDAETLLHLESQINRVIGAGKSGYLGAG